MPKCQEVNYLQKSNKTKKQVILFNVTLTFQNVMHFNKVKLNNR